MAQSRIAAGSVPLSVWGKDAPSSVMRNLRWRDLTGAGHRDLVELGRVGGRHGPLLVLGHVSQDLLQYLLRVGPDRIVVWVVVGPQQRVRPDALAGDDADAIVFKGSVA